MINYAAMYAAWVENNKGVQALLDEVKDSHNA